MTVLVAPMKVISTAYSINIITIPSTEDFLTPNDIANGRTWNNGEWMMGFSCGDLTKKAYQDTSIPVSRLSDY